MAQQVSSAPPLPFASNLNTIDALAWWNQDLNKALYGYLGDVALRLNNSLQMDGSEAMAGNLAMGTHNITGLGSITGTGTATFATLSLSGNATVTGTLGVTGVTTGTTINATTDVQRNGVNIDQWEVVYDQDQSSVSQIQITGLSAYESLRIKWWAYPVSGTTNWFYLRVGNGTTFIGAASSYNNTAIYNTEASATPTGYVTSSTVVECSLNNTCPLGNVYGNTWNVMVSGFNKATQTKFQGQVTFYNGTNILHGAVSHREAASAARDSLQLAINGGATPFSGHLFIEGKRG